MDTARMNAHVRRMTRTILRQKTLVLSVVLFYSCNVEARMCCNTCMSFALLPFVREEQSILNTTSSIRKCGITNHLAIDKKVG